MPTSPNYKLTLTGYVEELTSPTYQLSATLFTSTLTSPTYWASADVFLDKISSPVYQLTLEAPSYKLRGGQFADNTIEQDRFQPFLGHVISEVSGIDLTATGQTLLYTVPANEKVIPTGIVLVATSDPATADVEFQVGSDGSVDNILPATTALQFRATQDVWVSWFDGVSAVVEREQAINFEVITGAVGTLVADIYLVGFIL